MKESLNVFIAFLCVLLIMPACPAAGQAKASQPNILLIMTDDMGWMDLGCQANERLNTPVIDGLARQGGRFTDAYSAAPVCSPTRGAIITGLAPARLRITQHGEDIPRFWPEDRPVQVDSPIR